MHGSVHERCAQFKRFPFDYRHLFAAVYWINVFNVMKVTAEVAPECGSDRSLGAEPGQRQQSAFTGLNLIDGFSSIQ